MANGRILVVLAILVSALVCHFVVSRFAAPSAQPVLQNALATSIIVSDDAAGCNFSLHDTEATWPRPTLVYVNASVSLDDLKGMRPRNAAALCELFLYGNPNCQIEAGAEDFVGCVRRIGVERWSRALQPQCTRSAFWRALVVELTASKPAADAANTTNADVRDLFDPVMKVHVRPSMALRRRSRRPVANRTFASFAAPLLCPYGKVYPFGFCGSEEETDTTLPEAVLQQRGDDGVMRLAVVSPPVHKIWDWYPVLPSYVPYKRENKLRKSMGPRARFVSGAEDEYLHMLLYRLSYFAWTHVRMGADCQRHYDVFSGGAIPLFPDLHALPPYVLSHLPRRLMAKAFELPGLADGITPIAPTGRVSTKFYFRQSAVRQMNFRTVGSLRHGPCAQQGDARKKTKSALLFEPKRYHALHAEMRSFAKLGLTCSATMSYALRAMGRENPRSILYIGRKGIDYQGVSVERGLWELGLNYSVTAFPAEHHYDASSASHVQTGEQYHAWRTTQRLSEIYGRNFHVGRRIPPPPRSQRFDRRTLCSETVLSQFDMVLFSFPLGYGLILCEDLIAARIQSGALTAAVFDGGDNSFVQIYPRLAAKGFFIFSREARCSMDVATIAQKPRIPHSTDTVGPATSRPRGTQVPQVRRPQV